MTEKSNNKNSFMNLNVSVKDMVYLFLIIGGILGTYWKNQISRDDKNSQLETEVAVLKVEMKTIQDKQIEQNELIKEQNETNKQIYGIIFNLASSDSHNGE